MVLTHHSRRLARLTLGGIGAALLVAFALDAAAQQGALAVEDVARDGDAMAAGRSPRRVSIIAAPIPLANPAIGSGVTLVGMALYPVGSSPQPWITGVGALYADSKSWGVAVFQTASLAGDRFRFAATAGYGDANVKFYGVGQAADRSIDLEESGETGSLSALMRLTRGVYLGPTYRYLGLKSAARFTLPNHPELTPPALGLRTVVSSPGVKALLDARDSEFGPSRGVLATATWQLSDEAFGADFDYYKAEAAVNGYHPIGGGVLAARAAVCSAGRHAPFFDVCLFGSSNDLRGYAVGRYRDRASAAAQAEYRHPLFWRFGGVVFGGVGGSGPSLSDLTKTLPAGGAGLRFQASRQYKVNLSVDYAVGRDSHGLYLYIGEAF